MDARSLFAEHIERVLAHLEEALTHAREAGAHYERIVFHAGSERYYHADDNAVPFRTVPHFARLAPLPGPDHMVLFERGRRPRLVRVAPAGFWVESPADIDHPWADEFDVEVVGSRRDAVGALSPLLGRGRTAYLGNDPDLAHELGLATEDIEPAVLVRPLDWIRAYKTPYEVECLRAACGVAALGHAAVRRGVPRRRSEWLLHMDYLEATALLESEVPYTNIIAWDHNAATLHYQTKRREAPDAGRVLLIDAGASVWGYASDITRTYLNESAHPVFVALLDAMQALQTQLVEAVGPGREYVDVHAAAHRGIAAILHEVGILRVPPQEALERGLTRAFLPHGVGHHLGLQVHDVGGHQIAPDGTLRQPPHDHPFLRTTRPLEAGQVVTIEPGLYFIPMLLDPLRNGEARQALHWPLVDELIAFGGIRIEDDVLVTGAGRDNLSRPFVPGHRDPAPKRVRPERRVASR